MPERCPPWVVAHRTERSLLTGPLLWPASQLPQSCSVMFCDLLSPRLKAFLLPGRIRALQGLCPVSHLPSSFFPAQWGYKTSGAWSPGTPTSPLLSPPGSLLSNYGFMVGYWFHGWLLLWVELCPPQEIYRLPRWLSGKESTCQSRRPGFDPWVGKMPWRRKWQPTLLFLPGESHRQRSLAGYCPWGHKRVRHNRMMKQQWHTLESWPWYLRMWPYLEIGSWQK